MQKKYLWCLLMMSIELGSSEDKGFDYCCLDCNGAPHALCEQMIPLDEIDCDVQYYSLNFVEKINSRLKKPNDTLWHNQTKNKTAVTKKPRRKEFDFRNLIMLINQNRESLAIENRVPNMEAIVWDKELRDIALGAARTCGTVLPLCLDTASYQVTSMIYNHSGLTINPKEVMNHWTNGTLYGVIQTLGYEEYKPLAYPSISRIGCAIANYEHNKINMTQLTCLFGPLDNFQSGIIGHKGDPCSTCPLNTNCTAKGSLCEENVPRSWSWDPIRTRLCINLTLPDRSQWNSYIMADSVEKRVEKILVRGRHICDPIVINCETKSNRDQQDATYLLYIG